MEEAVLIERIHANLNINFKYAKKQIRRSKIINRGGLLLLWVIFWPPNWMHPLDLKQKSDIK